MRGLGLTRIDETYMTGPLVITEPAPKPVVDFYTPDMKPRTGGVMQTAIYRPQNDPACRYQGGQWVCVRANGAIETYNGPRPATTEPPPITTPATTAPESGPFGLSGNAFKLILLGGLAYLIVKK